MKTLIHLIILSLLIYSTNCKKKVGKKKEAEKYQAVKNVCDEEDQELAVPCHCTPAEYNTAKKAVCWVYRTKISGEDPVWDAFASQPNLEKLKFNIRPAGTLLNIPTNALKHLTQLLSLEIQYGYINELKPFVFANLSSITEISIPQNNIMNLHPFAVSHLSNLSVLNLDANKISEIRRDIIRDVPSLKMLYINRNNLSIIHDYAFEHLHKLEELEMNANQISIITKETFTGLKSLRYLDLRKNRLTMLGDHTFAELTNLYELDLDQNNIEYVSEKAFAGLQKLSKLRLSENQLKTLGEVFRETPNIFLLDLRMNALEALTFDTIEPLWENFKNVTSHVWLEKNRLKCDCHLSWVHTLRNETDNTELKLSLEELTCVTDEPEMESGAFTLATEKPSADPTYNVDVNSLQYDDEEVEYEDEIQSSEINNEAGKPPRKKIFDIPIEKLPCPEMQKATTEMPVKSSVAYWPEASSSNSNGAFGLQLDIFLLLAAVAVVYVDFSFAD